MHGWICTAIRSNVVELDLRFYVFELYNVGKLSSQCLKAFSLAKHGGSEGIALLRKLVSNCPVLEDLELKGYFPKAREFSSAEYLSLVASDGCDDCNFLAFNNLNKLYLDDLFECKFSISVFPRALNLQHIRLDLILGRLEQRSGQFNPPAFVHVCLSSHLNAIVLEGFKGLPYVMELAKYILAGDAHDTFHVQNWFKNDLLYGILLGFRNDEFKNIIINGGFI
ncbi:hypothetical protein ACFX1R_023635 [Malus domestica]